MTSLIRRRSNRSGCVSVQEKHDVSLGISGDVLVQNLVPAIGTAEAALTLGTSLQHPERIEQEVRMTAAAAEMSVPFGAVLIAIRGADGSEHVEHDVLQSLTVARIQ